MSIHWLVGISCQWYHIWAKPQLSRIYIHHCETNLIHNAFYNIEGIGMTDLHNVKHHLQINHIIMMKGSHRLIPIIYYMENNQNTDFTF